MLTGDQLRNRRRALGTEERALAVEIHRMQRERDAEPHELAFRPFRRFRKQRRRVVELLTYPRGHHRQLLLDGLREIVELGAEPSNLGLPRAYGLDE
jgi:hypothetical protein